MNGRERGQHSSSATDNMDRFAEHAHSIGELGGRSDDVPRSSVPWGTLKSDSVDRFFGPWLCRH